MARGRPPLNGTRNTWKAEDYMPLRVKAGGGGSSVGYGTALQVERSRVRFPIDIINSVFNINEYQE